MQELDPGLIESIYLIKRLHDSGMAEGLLKSYGNLEIDGDLYYEMAYEAIGSVFADTRNYYNEEKEFETWIFMDPMLDEFCRLCQEYERGRGVSEENNPFRKNMENSIRSGLSFGSYDYDFNWKFSPADRGRNRLLLFTGPEFAFESEVPCGLLEIRDSLDYCNKRLREELDGAGQIVVLPQPAEERKEAA